MLINYYRRVDKLMNEPVCASLYANDFKKGMNPVFLLVVGIQKDIFRS